MASSTLSNYTHLHDKCVCEMCNCGKHHCPKPHLKGDFHTSYEKHYPVHEGGSPTQSFKKNAVYEPSHYNQNQILTNYQSEFIPKQGAGKPTSVFERNGKSSVMQSGQFEGESAYNNAYKQFSGNYGDLRANILKRQNVVQRLPFEGESHYVENFTGAPSPPPQRIRIKGNLEVGSGKFDSESTYTKNYIPIQAQLPQKVIPRGNISVNQGKFDGDSTYAHNYTGVHGAPVEKAKVKNNLSLQEAKFSGQSTYTKNYTGSIGAPSSKIVNQGQLGLNQGKFDSSTTYNVNFDHKTGARQHGQRPPSQRDLLKNDNQSYNDKTSYTSNYQGGSGDRGQKVVHKSEFKIGSGGTFQGQSAYTNAYRGARLQPRGMVKPPNSNGIIPNGNFEGDSTYAKHYSEVKGIPSKPIKYRDSPLMEGPFTANTTYGDNYIEKSAERVSCPVDSLNPPKTNPLDQQHMRYNAKLGVWV